MSLSRLDRLARNPRLLFWARAFMELKMLNAIVNLFYLTRGVSIEEIFYLTIVYSVGTLLFEIPSGYLADWFGRKRLLIFGMFIVIASLACTFFAQGFWEMALTLILLSLADSCFSGTGQALIYDSLKELGREKEMSGIFARIESSRHLVKLFAPTIGALFAAQLLPWQFDVLIAINILFVIFGLALLFALEEPKRHDELAKTESLVYLETIRAVFSHPFLLRSAMNSTLIFIVAVITWRSYQVILESVGISIFLLGIFYFCMHFFVLLAKWNFKKLLSYISITTLLRGSSIALLILTLLGAIVHVPALLYITLLLTIIFCDIRAPLFAEAVNRRIASHHRATTLSNLALIKALIDIPLLFLAAHLAKINVQYPLFIGFGLVIVAVTFFRIKSTEIEVD